MLKEYILSERDSKNLEILLGITNSIDNLYKKLYALEVDNQKSSEEYMRTFDYLTIALEVEANKYENMKLTADKCIAISSYLLNSNITFFDKTNIEMILSGEIRSRGLVRILTILSNMILYDENKYNEVISGNLKSFFRATGARNYQKLVSDSMKISREMGMVFGDDSLKLFLSFVEEEINNRTNLLYVPKLLEVKYDSSFINKEIEIEMIRKNFTVSKPLLLSSKITADLINLDALLYEMLKNDYGAQIVANQLCELLETSDKAFGKHRTIISSLLRQAYMRAGFLFLNDELIISANEVFREYIDNPAYIESDYRISRKIIVNAFKKIIRDREKQNSLYLKLK